MSAPPAMLPTLSGGCACGAVRFSVRATTALFCHCALCRQFSGAPMTAWADVRRADFQLLRGEVAYYASSPHARRGFCPHCHTQLIYDSQQNGIEDFGITLYSLDTPNAIAPALHIWTQSKVINITDSLPQHQQETPEYTAALATAVSNAN